MNNADLVWFYQTIYLLQVAANFCTYAAGASNNTKSPLNFSVIDMIDIYFLIGNKSNLYLYISKR